MHAVLNSDAETFMFFWVPVNRATVFDIALVFDGLSFFIPTALLIYSLLKDRASLAIVSGLILVSLLLILFVILNIAL